MLNGLEVFLGFQPNFCIVGDCFRLVEELLFNHQSFISAKNTEIYFRSFFQITTNLKLTFLISKIMKNTYFESMLSIAFVDKAMVCFIIAIFQKFMMSKPGLMSNRKMCSNKYSFWSQ